MEQERPAPLAQIGKATQVPQQGYSSMAARRLGAHA